MRSASANVWVVLEVEEALGRAGGRGECQIEPSSARNTEYGWRLPLDLASTRQRNRVWVQSLSPEWFLQSVESA
jgi:hypothetical protein